MGDYIKRTWCEIDLNALKYNIDTIKSITDKKIIAVVKANAYGHDDENIVPFLEGLGAKFFLVSNIKEAETLKSLKNYRVWV